MGLLLGGGVKVVTMVTVGESVGKLAKEEIEVGVAVEGINPSSLVTVIRTDLLTLEAWHIKGHTPKVGVA